MGYDRISHHSRVKEPRQPYNPNDHYHGQPFKSRTHSSPLNLRAMNDRHGYSDPFQHQTPQTPTRRYIVISQVANSPKTDRAEPYIPRISTPTEHSKPGIFTTSVAVALLSMYASGFLMGCDEHISQTANAQTRPAATSPAEKPKYPTTTQVSTQPSANYYIFNGSIDHLPTGTKVMEILPSNSYIIKSDTSKSDLEKRGLTIKDYDPMSKLDDTLRGLTKSDKYVKIFIHPWDNVGTESLDKILDQAQRAPAYGGGRWVKGTDLPDLTKRLSDARAIDGGSTSVGPLIDFEKYLRAVEAKDLKAAWDLGSKQAQQAYGNDYNKFLKDSDAIIAAVRDLGNFPAFGEDAVDGNNARLSGMSLVPEGGGKKRVTMIRESGVWKQTSFKFDN